MRVKGGEGESSEGGSVDEGVTKYMQREMHVTKSARMRGPQTPNHQAPLLPARTVSHQF